MLRVGTCAWADHTGVYPSWLPVADRLTYYARYFPLVEVDSTFYRPATPTQCARWSERTPDHFRFHVKAHRSLTWHDRAARPRGTEIAAAARTLAAAVAPMVQAGKLAALHLQFAPWFTAGSETADYLRTTCTALADLPVAIEFRHRSWFSDPARTATTLALLRNLGASHTCCDEPQRGDACVPTVLAVTTPRLAVIRLHGRNAATWYVRGRHSGERFDYRYSPQELAQWRPTLQALSEQATEVHILFNNNHEDGAVRNAYEMASLLGLGYPDPWRGSLLGGMGASEPRG